MLQIVWRPGYLKRSLSDKVPKFNKARFFTVGSTEGKGRHEQASHKTWWSSGLPAVKTSNPTSLAVETSNPTSLAVNTSDPTSLAVATSNPTSLTVNTSNPT
jgi:hypothetical protein